MIYYDPMYAAHAEKWDELKIPCMPFSESTNYKFITQDVVCRDAFILDHGAIKPKDGTNPTGYDLEEMVAKHSAEALDKEAENLSDRLAQSSKDTGSEKFDASVIQGSSEIATAASKAATEGGAPKLAAEYDSMESDIIPDYTQPEY